MAQSRHRPAPPASASSSEEAILVPLPQAASLAELRAAMGSPGVIQAEVDALFAAVARPLADEETPRARADYLLSLMELPEEAAGHTGSDGRTVRAAAVEALLELGYPYALEVPPEVLESVRRERPPGRGKLKHLEPESAVPGVVLTVLALLAQLFLLAVVAFFIHDFHIHDGHEGDEDVFLLMLLGLVVLPPVLALLGLGLKQRPLQWVGSRAMLLQGLGWLGFTLLQAWNAYGDSAGYYLLLPWYAPLMAGYLMSPKPKAPVEPS